MIPFWKQALHPLGPIGAQALAQAMNLTCQLALVAILGQQGFAPLGLGLMAANSVCFLGEIGLGAYFLRETAQSPDWLPLWRQSSGSRLFALLLTFLLAWGGLLWSTPENSPSSQQALSVLWAAIPGLLVSAVNPLPLLFGQGMVRAASAAILLRFALQCVGGLGAVFLFPAYAAYGIGAMFSLGLIAQVVLGQGAGLPRLALCPAWPRTLPPLAALRLWGLSLVGTLSDRCLPFLIAKSHPDVLAVALIAIQGLQTLTGIWSQMDRLLIPAAARGQPLHDLWKVLRVPMGAMVGSVTIAMVAATALYAPGYGWAGFLFALEWGASVGGALAFSLAFARHKERLGAIFMLLVTPVSIVTQVMSAPFLPLEAILLLRLGVAMGVSLVVLYGLQSPSLAR